MLKSKSKIKSFRSKLLLKGLAFFVIFTVFITFYLLFRANINHQLVLLKDFKIQTYNISNSSKNLSLLTSDWKVVKDYNGYIERLVPTKDSLFSLPKNIESIASDAKVSSHFEFGKEIKSDKKIASGLGSIDFTLTVRGDAINIIEFLKKMENTYISMKVSVADLTSGNSINSSKLLIKGKIFFINS